MILLSFLTLSSETVKVTSPPVTTTTKAPTTTTTTTTRRVVTTRPTYTKSKQVIFPISLTKFIDPRRSSDSSLFSLTVPLPQLLFISEFLSYSSDF